MDYALLGKIFITVTIFIIVWVLTVLTIGNSGDWGDGMFAFFILGPALGLMAAVISWMWLLPPL